MGQVSIDPGKDFPDVPSGRGMKQVEEIISAEPKPMYSYDIQGGLYAYQAKRQADQKRLDAKPQGDYARGSAQDYAGNRWFQSF